MRGREKLTGEGWGLVAVYKRTAEEFGGITGTEGRHKH